MRIYINQVCELDPYGLEPSHEEYDAWAEGTLKVYRVLTDAICLDTGRKAQDALFGITVADGGDDYLRTVKSEQLATVLTELGFDIEETN